MRQSKLNLLIAQPYDNGYRPTCAKVYEHGEDQTNPSVLYWKVKPIEFNTLTQLLTQLKPYIEGTHQDAQYTSCYYGDIVEERIDSVTGTFTRGGATEDTLRNYLILDIETNAKDYEHIASDIDKIYDWLLETYDWLDEDTGILIHQSGSAGVKVKEKHKQIRIRAFVMLPQYMNRNGRNYLLRDHITKDNTDFDRHIDKVSAYHHQLFIPSPPILKDTDHIELSKRWKLVEGKAIDLDKIKPHIDEEEFDNDSSVKGESPKNKGVKLPDIDSQAPESLLEAIRPGHTWAGIYRYLQKMYKLDREEEGIKNLLDHKPLKDHERGKEEYLRKILGIIKKDTTIPFNTPFTPHKKHNVINVDKALLKDWEGEIDYIFKDKKVILGKLYEGAGKTQSLKQLIKKHPDKSFLYIAPTIAPVEAFCKDVGIPFYQEFENKGDLKHENKIGVCYNSIKHFIERDKEHQFIRKYDIVVIDEIEELLINACVGNHVEEKELLDNVFVQFIYGADLVVGLDARITNVSLYYLEHIREDKECFDIYSHETVLPFKDHHFDFVNEIGEGVEKVISAILKGKKVAIVSELTCNMEGKRNLEFLKSYVEKRTGQRGIAIDSDEKQKDAYKYGLLTDLSRIEDGHKGQIEQELTTDILSHLWLSPVTQSSWSYLAIEETGKFDLVFGLYPSRPPKLTAPNILQHIKRFRQTKDFILYVDAPGHDWINFAEIFRQLNPEYSGITDKDIYAFEELKKQKYELLQLPEETELKRRARTTLNTIKVQGNNRNKHLKEEIIARGGTYTTYEDNTEKSNFRTEIHNQHKQLKEIMLKAETWKKAEKEYSKPQNPEATFLQLQQKEDKSLEDWALIFIYEIRYSKNWGYEIQDQKEVEEILEHRFISNRSETKFNRNLFNIEDRKESAIYDLSERKNLKQKGELIDNWCKVAKIKKGGFEIVDRIIYIEEIKQSEWYLSILQYWNLLHTLYPHCTPPKKESFRNNPSIFFRQFGKQVLGIIIKKKEGKAGATKSWNRLISEHKKRDIYRRPVPRGLGLEKTPTATNGKNGKKHYSKLWLSKNKDNRTPLEKVFCEEYFDTLIINKNQPRWKGYSLEIDQNQQRDNTLMLERREF